MHLEVQLLLWHLIDDSYWQMDYLKIFELDQENHTNKLIVIQRQEELRWMLKGTFQLSKPAEGSYKRSKPPYYSQISMKED